MLGATVAGATGGGWDTAVALAYPMGDVLLVVMVVVARHAARLAREPGLAAARRRRCAAHVIADAGYVISGLADERRALWVPIVGARLAAADRGRGLEPGHARRAQVALDGWRTLVTPTLLALVAGGLLVADHFHQTIDAAVWLAAATLVAVLGRMALTFVENTALHATRASWR